MSFRAFFDALCDPKSVVIEIRLPRIILAILVGCALSASGTAAQALFRNPMADPYIIGISAGAAVGASSVFFFHINISEFAYTLPLMAFIGAALAVFAVYGIARGAGGRIRMETLLLSGIAVSSFLTAVTAYIMYASGNQFKSIFFWLLGGLTSATWDTVMIACIPIIAGIVALQFFARDLNAVTLGEETAMHLGIEVRDLNKIVLILMAVVAGTAVAFSGIIGFVGLIIPHMMRMLVGPNHKALLPVSTVAGGIFLIWTDAIARNLLEGVEIPLGIITALCGAPFFIYLLLKSKK
jgi:iron complex transport system permease protein